MSFLLKEHTDFEPQIEVIDYLIVNYKGNRLRMIFDKVLDEGEDY